MESQAWEINSDSLTDGPTDSLQSANIAWLQAQTAQMNSHTTLNKVREREATLRAAFLSRQLKHEPKRQAAELATMEAERKRAEADTRQADAEAERQTAGRVTVEADRKLSETRKIQADAETKRANAETKRATAETKRANAETTWFAAMTKLAEAEKRLVDIQNAKLLSHSRIQCVD